MPAMPPGRMPLRRRSPKLLRIPASQLLVAATLLSGGRGQPEVPGLDARGGGAQEAIRALAGDETQLRRLVVISNDLNPNRTALEVVLAVGGGASCSPYNGGCTTMYGIVAGSPINSILVRVEGPAVPCPPNCDTFDYGLFPKLRVVRAPMTEAMASAQQKCATGDLVARVAAVTDAWVVDANNVGGAPGTVVYVNSAPSGRLTAPALTFKMGGDYQLCFSENGQFSTSHADVVPAIMKVDGIYDNRLQCQNTETCLRTRKYHCYLLRQSYNNMDDSFQSPTNCIADYSYADAGYKGQRGKGTVSARYTTTKDATTGEYIATPPGGLFGFPCTSYPADFLCSTETDCDAPVSAFLPNVLQGVFQKRIVEPNVSVKCSSPNSNLMGCQLPMAHGRPDLVGSSFMAATVAACYCPGTYGGCNDATDYVQQVGVMHYYILKVCVPGTSAGKSDTIQGCALVYNGVTPQSRFAMRVEGPTNAMSFKNNGNRIKIIQQLSVNDLPSWTYDSLTGLPGHGCGMVGFEAHGKLSDGMNIFPAASNFPVATMGGGERQDAKIYNFIDTTYNKSTAGFLLKTGTTDFELRNFYQSTTLDVCYCDSDCNGPPIVSGMNWFKVGQLRIASFRLVSAAANTSSSSYELSLEYVNQPGQVAFARPLLDYQVMGLQEGGIIKFVEDNAMTMTDQGCSNAVYDGDLSDLTLAKAMAYHTGSSGFQTSIPTSAPTHGLGNPTMSPTFAPTQMPSRIPTTNPTLASGIGPTEEPTMAPTVNRDDLTQRLVFNGGSVDNQLVVKKAGTIAICYCQFVNMYGCANNEWVMAVRTTIRGPTRDHWKFSTNVPFRLSFYGYGLSSKDMIRIIPSTSSCSNGDGDPSGSYSVTDVKLMCPHPCSEVGSVTDVVNGDISVNVLSSDAYGCDKQNMGCRDMDIKSITVLNGTATAVEFELPPYFDNGDLLTLESNIACKNGPPLCNDEKLSALMGKFHMHDTSNNHAYSTDSYIAGHAITNTVNSKIVNIPVGWSTDVPEFKALYVGGKQGRWTRHSQAVTKEEVMGNRERQGMKICWKYPGMLGKYIAQVGTIDLIDPNPMGYARIDLVSDVMDQQAPLILSFRTAGAFTGQAYENVQGPTLLQINFFRDVALDVTFVDGSSIETNEGEDEVIDARQYICGKIFSEVWSNDKERGFPMPKGCYYRVYGMTKQLNVVFDRKNGLAPGSEYQMVVMGRALSEAVADGEYVELFTMSDIDLTPYEAIERGVATLGKTPQKPSYGADGVKWLYPDGFKLVGGPGANLLELRANTARTPLQMQLRGDTSMGGIKTNAIMRVYLFPLLMWDVDKLCEAECLPFDQVTAPCLEIQECKGDSLVPSSNFNQIFVRLPAVMAQITQYVTHTVSITNLVLPEGGFFPTRIAAQISTRADTKPDWITSMGDFLWKVPDEGQTVGKLVEVFGDGDQMPFKQQRKNVLYASITLAATLFSAVDGGDAVMTVRMPQGYRCILSLDLQGPYGATSPWKAEDLAAFGGVVPTGAGAPDEGSGTRGWSVRGNECIYTLRQNAIIYAGTSLYVRVTADNPQDPLKRDDLRNFWQVSVRSKGDYVLPVEFPPHNFKTSDGSYSNNKAVLGRMVNSYMMAENFAQSLNTNVISKGRLYIVFQTEQYTGVYAGLELVAPKEFTFDNPCVAEDLPEMYYGNRNHSATRRLPGILPTSQGGCVSSLDPYNRMTIKMDGGLSKGTYYGFQTEVANPMFFSEAFRSGWQIFTLSQYGHRVDGTPEPIELVKVSSNLEDAINITSKSFALCTTRLQQDGFSFEVDSMRPADLTMGILVPTTATLRFKLPFSASIPMPPGPMTLKVVAPDGYVFDFSDKDFVYKAPYPNATEPVIMGAQADWPGFQPVPERDGNVLFFSIPEEYVPGTAYAFKVPVHIPSYTPTSSINAAYAGFYFGDTCYAAASQMMGTVEAFINAKVDYITNVESKENTVVFTLETTSDLSDESCIEFTSPYGFRHSGLCNIVQASGERGSPYDVVKTQVLVKELPITDLTCITEEVFGDPGVGVRIKLTLKQDKELLRGRYRWQMVMRNPSKVEPNLPTSGTPCDYEHCWTFRSFNNIGVLVEAPMSVPSFRINTKMVQATIPPMTPAQRAMSRRDDRPTHSNPVVFTIKLGKPALLAELLIVRGPAGYLFAEDCLQNIETREVEVFGGMPLNSDMVPWVPEVLITSCRGEGPDAVLYVDPNISLGLRPDRSYPFRFTILANPEMQANPNKWTIDFNGESSDPFEGIKLSTFTRTSILPVSKSFSTPITGEMPMKNPVTFTLRPFNKVMGQYMKIKVTAPPNFLIANEYGVCEIIVQPVSDDYIGLLTAPAYEAPEMNFIGPPSLIWNVADVDCQVDPDNPRHMVANVLAETRELMANRDYQITVYVHNPQGMISDEDNRWILETDTGTLDSGVLPVFRDWIRIPGYTLNERATKWLYLNEQPGTRITFVKGQEEIPGLYFEFMFPKKLVIDEIIEVQAPVGFYFQPNPNSNECPGFRWEGTDAVQLTKTLAGGHVTCNGDKMKFLIKDSCPQQTLVGFRIDSKNPPKTPHVMLNYWLITDYFGPSPSGLGGEIAASEAFAGWVIYPQLKQINIFIVGANKAAGSMSDLAISFVPVSDADELFLEARMPTNFDFTGSVTTSFSHEVIETNIERIRVRAPMYADLQADVRIVNMRLGLGGGPTEFDLVTKLSNGIKMDESVGYRGAFRLPGLVDVVSKQLQSPYQLDNIAYPVASLWGARMKETGRATFRFTVTMPVNVGNMISVEALLYALSDNGVFKVERFRKEDGQRDPLLCPVISISGGELVARVDMKMWTDYTYEMTLGVVTPSVPAASGAMWRIEVLDGEPLPVNTNDATTLGFDLVDKIEVRVQTGAAPPVAEVIAQVRFDPKKLMPTTAILVAPLGFNFTVACLVYGGDFNEVLGCELMEETIANRAVARLTLKNGGLDAPPEFVQIKIMTPPMNGEDRSWYVNLLDAQGVDLGWGEDPVGVSVSQMSESGVVYPRIPEIEGVLAIRFTLNTKVDAGGKIRVGYPQKFVVKCGGEFFYPVSLQGDITCANFPKSGYFELTMARPLPPGKQAFAVTGTTPPDVPDGFNMFYIMVYSPQGKVVDAAMGLPGLEPQPGLAVTATDLFWSASEAGKPSNIALGFELLEPLELNGKVPPPTMSELVVNVPPDFQQTVQKLSQIEVMAHPLPLVGGGAWLDASDPKVLRLFFDPEKTKRLAIGLYRFSFPLMVPSRIPAYNFFTLTICTPSATNASCTGQNDPRALVTFPFPSFNFGEEHPAANQYAMTGGARQAGAGTLVISVLSWLARAAALTFATRS